MNVTIVSNLEKSIHMLTWDRDIILVISFDLKLGEKGSQHLNFLENDCNWIWKLSIWHRTAMTFCASKSNLSKHKIQKYINAKIQWFKNKKDVKIQKQNRASWKYFFPYTNFVFFSKVNADQTKSYLLTLWMNTINETRYQRVNADLELAFEIGADLLAE